MTGKILDAERNDISLHCDMDEQRFGDVWKAIDKLCRSIDAKEARKAEQEASNRTWLRSLALAVIVLAIGTVAERFF